MRAIGYVRVSTEEQAESGLSLEHQKERIRAECRHRDLELIEIVEDRGVSAGSLEREGLRRVLDSVEVNPYLSTGQEPDTLIVTRLDRLSRSMADFADLLKRAQEEDWNLIVIDLGLDLSTPNGRFVAHIMAAVAELERELISQRTKEAMAQAKKNGVKLGRPPADVPDFVVEYISAAREADIPYRDIADELNELDYPTPTGEGQWWPSTVMRVYERHVTEN